MIAMLVAIYLYSHRPAIFDQTNNSQAVPLILLFTRNHSAKTRANICQGTRNGGHVVNFHSCPVKCEFSCRINDFKQRSPHAVLFFGEDFAWPFQITNRNRTSFDQRWIFWTMTYRQDSDIVHSYGWYIARNMSYAIHDMQAIDFYLSPNDNQSLYDIENEFQQRKNKTLWFVSNCHARSRRYNIAQNLSKYFPTDQYGQCLKKNEYLSKEEFHKTLFRYKFYLAFENAHCQDYITEKAFFNALAHGSIPIVLGPGKKNYQQILPPNSFIHIDDFQNVTELTDELILISKNLQRFAFYHQWRQDYRLITWPSNYFIDDLFCNLCRKLHQDTEPKIYSNFSQWLNKCKQ
ncbi:unnamed protein product [Adineta ricciae]|uniref:Fucosyltransferase n=1 Tax=Adineta ricciae TaxID=249248 RepID=A0A813WQJ8_ADIRI|nr:unnamed protein product [Adineta ricciae]CAF1293929.1 unnamed protein product [Adineta ricciae]